MNVKRKTLKKAFGILHLWLGLTSGIIIFIVCITAAIWAFSPEIENVTQPYRHVVVETKPLLPITVLKNNAEKRLPGKKANRVNFNGKDKAATIDFYGEDYYYSAFINPYSGELLKLKDNKNDFFSVVLTGHYSLWLGDIGKEIVKWATLVFLLILISGMVLWWPRNKAARKQRFKIKLGTSPKRLNYDLHNVLGFYASWVIIFAVLTGLVWVFEPLAKAEYWLASGGDSFPQYPNPISKKVVNGKPANTIDDVFASHLQQDDKFHIASLYFPADDSAAYQLSIYPHENYYEGDNYYLNQYTLEEIPVTAFGRYAAANNGEKLSRMNYDIHIGNIAGLPGRIVMFFSILIMASLPVTGFYIWYGRKKKSKQKAKTIIKGNTENETAVQLAADNSFF